MLYRCALTQIVGGRNIGTSLFVDEFFTVHDAVKMAVDHKLVNSMAVIEVREYEDSGTVAWNDPSLDTGIVVYRDVSAVTSAIKKEFVRGKLSMSALLDDIRYGDIPEINYLRPGLALLTDEEVEDLLKNCERTDFSKELVASLILGEAVTDSSEGNWIFSKDELADKYGITSPSELKEVVETIDNLYPEAMLDDPLDYSDPGELNINLAEEWTLSYWEGRDDMPNSMRDKLFTLSKLYDSYRQSRYYTGLFEHWSARVEQKRAA